jgi:hypothetical protein
MMANISYKKKKKNDSEYIILVINYSVLLKTPKISQKYSHPLIILFEPIKTQRKGRVQLFFIFYFLSL